MFWKNSADAKDLLSENDDLKTSIEFVANKVLESVLKNELLQDMKRKAFIIVLRKKGVSTPFFKSKIGTDFLSNDVRSESWELAEEKVDRMFLHGHVSSYQSRIDVLRQYGGAICIEINAQATWGMGISGLRELENEACAIVIAMYVFRIPYEDRRIQNILDKSKNHELTKKILDAVKKNDQYYYTERIAQCGVT